MNILSAEKVSKSYSEKILFNEITLGINEGEKIGLIGINGTGKSTLLKVLAGVEQPDAGKITKGSSVSIEYLSQNPSYDRKATVIQQVFAGNSPVMSLIREYEATLHQLEQKPGDPPLEKRLPVLMQQMESVNAWTVENEAKSILTKLGISDFHAAMENLSGGQKKRVAMAGALIHPADLLILDEPTNHLDNDTIDWLEKYLNNRRGALLMVTHDRYFLDRVVNRIIELEGGKLYSYQANYSRYLEIKAERQDMEQAAERKRKTLFRTELEWIKRGARARSTKQKARIERFEKLQEGQCLSPSGNVEIIAGSTRLGRKTIELEYIGKGFSGVTLLHDFNYIFQRDDRIGVIGPNGSGKSTLLNIIAGRLSPDEGRVETGETVKVRYFSQENEEMDGSLRVIEYIREEAEYLTTRDGSISASQMLENFLFPPEVQWTPVAKLSGGEKRRLYLLRILMGAPNILLLDEPTNDLDIQTLTILESYLDDFPGAVIAVSHDRYFLDRIADRLFLLGAGDEGVIRQFEGSYSAYSESMQTAEDLHDQSLKGKTNKESSNAENKKNRPVKFTFKEQREFEGIDEQIAGLEQELQEVTAGVAEATSDFERLQQLLAAQEQLESRLNEAMERWVYLNELSESISESKKEPKGEGNDETL